ncbi:hypothetical protein MYCTH_2305406 [Thermothelomyces thermophilus ATCC 42464]|uniref:F-box domain-containing protein n=1 Tax=Thermothelomyces thermophilus (strain ATCC 42464 / BCRC 31852 / DSM 1799) TaxID=573729 RepID=G2QCT7_THET4|nr:uncharacterized protein MYCTH_2305406 [Thermothelomyces thermophilus ATCC 42464]AEO58208.1 hypothetical protein MYCTH_2305406 [Thermothelomyces thermophilus ATCC 42464]
MFPNAPATIPVGPSPQEDRAHNSALHPPRARLRSMSVSLPWRHRLKSSLLEPSLENGTGYHGHRLEKSRSHHGFDRQEDVQLPPTSSIQGNFKRMLRRASVSLKTGVKGFIHRRTSVPATTTFDTDGRPARPQLTGSSHHASRPTTSYSAWHRLRKEASFQRHSQTPFPGYADRTFAHDLDPIESPTLPIPGSGEQPPIIPRNTGAAARHAAAIACNGRHGCDLMDMPMPVPRPGWLAKDGGLDDRESGIGIALTSCETEPYIPEDEVDSDVDVGTSSNCDEAAIVKVDFISQLPLELAIQILALLDAPTLNTASRVCSGWYHVIRNQHIWRESFLREKTTTYATSGPVKPGAGLGVPRVRPTNDWREIYRAKTELDRRWKEGKARPVYLNGHTDSIYCLQFDESKIITGSRDRTIRVWDMHTFACKLVIGPPEIVNDNSAALLYDENNIPVHHATLPDVDPSPTPDGLPRAPIRAYHSVPALYAPPIHHKASILCLQYDDRILVTGSSDSTCIIYSLADGFRPVRRLRHHSAAVLDLVFDDKHIVTCSKDVSICVWDRATGALLRQLRGHSGPVNAVQMRGNTIVSCSGDFKVKLWNIDTGKNIREFLGHSKGLACSQFSEDGRYIASAGNDRAIRIWDANTGECVREMRAHENLVRSLHVDSISGRLVSASYDSDIKVWDMETGQPLLDFPKWHSSWVLSAKSDYRRIVSSGQDPKILILDFGAGVRGIEMLESTPAEGEEEPEANQAKRGVHI